MIKRSAKLLEEALILTPVERIELVEKILNSLDTSESQKRIDELWARESEERIDAFDRGEIKASSAKEVFEKIDRQK